MKKLQPRIFTLKQRIGAFIGVLFVFVPLTILSVWIGLDSLSSNWSFPSSLVFSWGEVLLLFAPVLFVPLFIMAMPPIFIGKEMTVKSALPLLKIMIWGCAIAVLVAVLYAFYFTNQLEQRGYISCRGIPTGYMPGMGTRYVTNLSLCHH